MIKSLYYLAPFLDFGSLGFINFMKNVSLVINIQVLALQGPHRSKHTASFLQPWRADSNSPPPPPPPRSLPAWCLPPAGYLTDPADGQPSQRGFLQDQEGFPFVHLTMENSPRELQVRWRLCSFPAPSSPFIHHSLIPLSISLLK